MAGRFNLKLRAHFFNKIGPATDIETVAGRNIKPPCRNSGLAIDYLAHQPQMGRWSCQKLESIVHLT